jgi:predicted Zn-dependent protease
MKKIFLQLIVVVTLFFSLFFLLEKVNWMKILHVDKATASTEKKLGDLFWDMYDKAENEIKGKRATRPLDSLMSAICTANHIDQSKIKLHLMESDEINAFALPDNHLVVNSALVTACEDETELCGVMSHEIAHMELKHVMKKLVKEVGLSVLISVTGGGSGSKQVHELAKMLSSSAYDRNLEKEADLKAVDYMTRADIDPEGFANFLYRLGDNESSTMKYFSWISTHPDSKERAEYLLAYSKDTRVQAKSVLTKKTWDELQDYLREK